MERKKLKKLNSNQKKKTENGVKRYHSYKIKINRNTQELKGELMKYKVYFSTIKFENPYPNIPNNKEIKTTSIIKNLLNKDDLSEYCTSSSTDLFFNETTSYILDIFNSLNNKFSDNTQFPFINKIFGFRKIEDMLGDGLCCYYGILSQLFPKIYRGDILGDCSNNVEMKKKAISLKEN
jgi:hypothetical protein